METVKNDRHKSWKEKQAAEGKKPISVIVSNYVKELIDREKKRTDSTIAEIIERAVINFVDPGTKDSTSHNEIRTDPKQLSTDEIQSLVNDLKSIVHRIEEISGIKDVTKDKLASSNEDLEELIIKHPNGKNIIYSVRLHRTQGASPDTIASLMNRGKNKTFRGGDKWTVEDIEELFKEFDTKGLHLKIMYGRNRC